MRYAGFGGSHASACKRGRTELESTDARTAYAHGFLGAEGARRVAPIFSAVQPRWQFLVRAADGIPDCARAGRDDNGQADEESSGGDGGGGLVRHARDAPFVQIGGIRFAYSVLRATAGLEGENVDK